MTYKRFNKRQLIRLADIYGLKRWYFWFYSKKKIRKIITSSIKGNHATT